MHDAQLAGHATHAPPASSKKPSLHEHDPSPLFDAFAWHCVHESGAVQDSHPARHTGVWHWSPVHSVAEQSHVQSVFWTPPFWHAMLHWHVPARSHCPKPGAQLLLSHSTLQVGP